MTIIDTLAGWLGYSKAGEPVPSPLLALADGERWNYPDMSLAEKQANLYINLNWLGTAIDAVASIAAGGVFSVKRLSGGPDGDDEDIPNHPFELLLRRPNPAQSRGEFLRDAFSWFKLTGNLYIFLNTPSEGVPPSELWIMPSQMMRPLPDGQAYIKGYEFTAPNQSPEFIEPWKIMHLKTFNPRSPFVGASPVQALGLDGEGDIAQQRWNLSLFAKNNGKFPGILAFKHMIGDPEWDRIKKTRADEWGGAKQSGVMLLRGVGDTVQWLPAALSQKDMDFLAGRKFTKTEFYERLAPGLVSILSENSTEANAIAGKSTLIEYGVWPMMDQFAQKATSDLLPLYEDNLEGEFDDIRQTNRILDIQEQEEYAKFHTVNEVRAEYYAEDPLELDPSVIEQIEAKDAAQAEMDANMPAPATALVPFGGKADMPVSKLDPRGFLFAAQISPTTPNPADVAKPTPPAPAMVPGQPPMMQTEGDTVPDQQAAGEELAKWEKFAIARLGKPAREFEPRVLPLMQAARIQTALKSVKTAADVRGIFDLEREQPDLLEIGRQLTAAIEKATERLT